MNTKRCKRLIIGGKKEFSRPLIGSEKETQEGEKGEVEMEGGDREECGRPLLLGKNERSEIDYCVNPSLQRQKANTPELAATLLPLASSPTLASPGQLSLLYEDRV